MEKGHNLKLKGEGWDKKPTPNSKRRVLLKRRGRNGLDMLTYPVKSQESVVIQKFTTPKSNLKLINYDHIELKAKGGGNKLNNLRLVHAHCHDQRYALETK